jgi:hypothetical protein
MSVEIGPGYSVVLRKDSLARLGDLSLLGLGGVHSEDDMLLVLGPFFETKDVTRRLEEMGLVYFEDYFDLAHSGGQVPDWCKVTLSYRETEPSR